MANINKNSFINKNIKAIKKCWNSFCKIFFPSNIKCLCCGRDLPEKREIEFCDKCKSKLPYLSDKYICKVCGIDIPGMGSVCLQCKTNKRRFKENRSVFVYDGFIRKLILDFKFENKRYLANTFGNELAKLFETLDWNIDVVVPAPLGPKRLKSRGYNQSELLAKAFCKKANLSLSTKILYKIRDTSQQSKSTYAERHKNLTGSIKVENKILVKDRNILLIDDILTSGATANCCAKALYKAGANAVYVLTIARASVKIPQEKGI